MNKSLSYKKDENPSTPYQKMNIGGENDDIINGDASRLKNKKTNLEKNHHEIKEAN